MIIIALDYISKGGMLMNINNIISIIISILGSSVITLILSTIIFQPMQDKRKYIFDEKRDYMTL